MRFSAPVFCFLALATASASALELRGGFSFDLSQGNTTCLGTACTSSSDQATIQTLASCATTNITCVCQGVNALSSGCSSCFISVAAQEANITVSQFDSLCNISPSSGSSASASPTGSSASPTPTSGASGLHNLQMGGMMAGALTAVALLLSA